MVIKKESGCYLEKLKSFMTGIVQQDETLLYTMCQEEFVWKVNEFYGNRTQLKRFYTQFAATGTGKKIRKVRLKNLLTIELGQNAVQLSGELITEVREGTAADAAYEILLTFLEGKIVYFQLLERKKGNKLIHKVKEVNEDFQFVEEEEILYIEAAHNHAIWHCMDKKIVSGDSLQHLESELSEQFVRIQRGYLVNKEHIRCIRRCEVEMKNADVLAIPCRTYVSIKNKLIQN